MLALTLCCVMFVGFEAQASETLVLTREMREELKDNLEELGVPYDVQEALISKLQSGEVWDSMKEENIEKFIYDMWTDERYMEFEHRIDKFKEIISHKTFRRINELDKIWENFQRNASESAKVGQDFVSDGTVLMH